MDILRKALAKCICSDNRTILKHLILILLICSISVSAQSQVEIDTNPSDTTVVSERYIDYSNQLLLKFMSVTKLNSLEIVNTTSGQSINLEPYGISSLGFGFNYKWLGLGVTLGLPLTSEEEEKYGKTKRFDLQLNIYSKKFVIDASFQQYNGYYVTNPGELFPNWNDSIFPQRETMETFSVGVSGYYVFNHKKLSYKAAYVRNAVQKKSAGSFLLGGFYSIDDASFDDDTSSFVPSSFPTEIQDSLPINAYSARSAGVSFGYTYTLVFFKRFFINLSLIPGVGVKSLAVDKAGEKFTETSGVGRFNGRVALGYESKHFLIGITSNTVTGTLKFQNYVIKPSTKNVKVFIAKRFNINKKK